MEYATPVLERVSKPTMLPSSRWKYIPGHSKIDAHHNFWLHGLGSHDYDPVSPMLATQAQYSSSMEEQDDWQLSTIYEPIARG
jgi:hypothetical protein